MSASKTNADPVQDAAKAHASQLARNALSYLEKLDRYDCQELLAYVSTHWLLSNEDFRLPTDPPAGLISNVNIIPTSNMCIVLFPEHPDLPPIDYRELHNLVRELTYGIYIMHQTPSISLEANFDESTSCQIPPAYMDTRIGQMLVSVDYLMKCLWHGAYIPKDKRIKFSERWRSSVDVNQSGKPETKKPLLPEFTTAGLCDITTKPEFKNAYNSLPVEHAGDPSVVEDKRFFMSHVEDMSMEIHFFQKSVNHHQNIFLVDADFVVSSCVRQLEDGPDRCGYERLQKRLQYHEAMIKENLVKKADIVYQLELLKFVSYMTPFLMGMKKRMKIPDTSRLLPPLAGDECRTERELPPLIVGPDFKCKNFTFGQEYFHLHGGIRIDLTTDPMNAAHEDVDKKYDQMCEECVKHLSMLLENEIQSQDLCKMLSYKINGQRYWAVVLDFETYYGITPQKPLWVRAFSDQMIKIKPKKLPMTDIHVHEQFKKFYGYKKASKFKSPALGLKAVTLRGLVAMFQALSRKVPSSRAVKPDEQGLSFLHYAAMHNRPHIIAILLMNSADVNLRRALPAGTGITALHVAARCGALDAVECMLCVNADVWAVEHEGWAPIHLAAYFDHRPIVKALVCKAAMQLELETKNSLKSKPLLLAAGSGALSAVECLIELGADITCLDTEGNNIVVLAALHIHTNVLEHLIKWNHPKMHVWTVFVGMLSSDSMRKKENAVKCLDILTRFQSEYWKPILSAGAMPALVKLLTDKSETLQSLVTCVLCNLSEIHAVRLALTGAEAAPILIQLLSSPVDDIHSRAAIILSDMGHIEGNQECIAENGGLMPLAKLLDSCLEDVLVNATSAIKVLCSDNKVNQTEAINCGVAQPLVEFLTVASDDLQASTAATLCALCSGNKENQDAIMAQGAAKPLVDLIRSSRSITVQVKAATALEALALNNFDSQQIFLNLDAPKALIRLLKNIFTEVREQGACALWALAGDSKTQQKYIAQRITIPHIIQMLLESTEKLLRVGCMTAIALGQEDQTNQNKLAEADAIQQLVRLLRTRKKNDSVLLLVIQVLGILCVGVAYRNNKETQRCIAEEGGIRVFVHMLLEPPSEEVQVEVAISLAYVVLSNRQNQEKLQEEPHFHFDILLHLLSSYREHIRLKAGMALTIFAFNNTPQQLAIREAGGIKFSVFEAFFESKDEFEQCYSAFQVVVLARVIVDGDQVHLTAKGISQLVDKLRSQDDRVLVLASSFLASLCHTRSGIPDAMVAADIIELLVNHLYSPNIQVRNGAAVTLGYLSFNKTAARLLFSICRNNPECFDRLMANLGLDPRICSKFVKSFVSARQTGLPSQWSQKQNRDRQE